MTVTELIEELTKLNGDRQVILQKDGEGNGYSPLAGIWSGKYEADCTWSGEAKLEELTEQDRLNGYSEEDLSINGAPAVILFPVN